MAITAMANGAVPRTLQRAFSHWSPNAAAVITAKVSAIRIKPCTILMPGFYHKTVSGFRKKD